MSGWVSGAINEWSLYDYLLSTGVKLSVWSTFKAVRSYGGACMRVRRVSDSAEMDVGFIDDTIDIAGLESWLAGSRGEVVTWYDQGGNGHHMTVFEGLAADIADETGKVQLSDGKPVVSVPEQRGYYRVPMTPPLGGNHALLSFVQSNENTTTDWADFISTGNTAQGRLKSGIDTKQAIKNYRIYARRGPPEPSYTGSDLTIVEDAGTEDVEGVSAEFTAGAVYGQSRDGNEVEESLYNYDFDFDHVAILGNSLGPSEPNKHFAGIVGELAIIHDHDQVIDYRTLSGDWIRYARVPAEPLPGVGRQEGNVRLYHTADGGEVDVIDQQIVLNGGLETSAYLSLFGGEEDGSDWWANQTIESDSDRMISRTQALLRGLPATSSNLRRLHDAAISDLAWMMKDGIASKVEVSVRIPAYARVEFTIDISAEGEESTFKFTENWKAQ